MVMMLWIKRGCIDRWPKDSLVRTQGFWMNSIGRLVCLGQLSKLYAQYWAKFSLFSGAKIDCQNRFSSSLHFLKTPNIEPSAFRMRLHFRWTQRTEQPDKNEPGHFGLYVCMEKVRMKKIIICFINPRWFIEISIFFPQQQLENWGQAAW